MGGLEVSTLKGNGFYGKRAVLQALKSEGHFTRTNKSSSGLAGVAFHPAIQGTPAEVAMFSQKGSIYLPDTHICQDKLPYRFYLLSFQLAFFLVKYLWVKLAEKGAFGFSYMSNSFRKPVKIAERPGA